MYKSVLAELSKRFERKLVPINRIEIKAKAILSNYDSFVKVCEGKEIWPVLKSDAYGHGIREITEILKSRDFKYLVLDSYMEALEVWKIDPKREILLIGPLLTQNYKLVDWKKVTIMVQDMDQIRELAKLPNRVRIHIKVNCGMNRQGFEIDELNELINKIRKFKYLEIEGLMSHLSNADEANIGVTKKQNDNFSRALKIFEDNGIGLKYIHLAATGGSIRTTGKQINAVRLGIGLYGFGPWEEGFGQTGINLEPGLKLFSKIVKIRMVRKGEGVSYGLTYKAKRDSWLGLIPVGYYEGLDRRLSSNHWIKYKKRYYLVAGRICMNMCLIDFGNVKPKLYDEVEVVGVEGKNSICEMAVRQKTIDYEVLVKLNQSIRREIV